MKNNNKGFTLIEIICSVALLSIIVTASASFFTGVLKSQRGSKEQLYANNIAQEVMEELIRTGDLSKDYSAAYDGYIVEINATAAPIGSGVGGNSNYGQNNENNPSSTKVPITYDTTNRIPEEGTKNTPAPTGDGVWNNGRPDKYSLNLDTSDYLDDDLYALYYAGLQLENAISNRTPSAEVQKRSTPKAVYNYFDNDLIADIKNIDFSFLPNSIGDNSFANKSFAFYRYLNKEQIHLLYSEFKEQIDNFYATNISARLSNCSNDAIKNYWTSFEGNYTKNQYSAIKDWFNIACDVLQQYGVDREGAIASVYQYGNPHILTLSDIAANKTYSPEYANYMDTANYFIGLTVSDLFLLKQNFLQPIYQQISRSEIVESIEGDPVSYGHGPFYIYKVLSLDEDQRRADEKAGLNTSLIDYTTLDRMVYVSKYTQDSLDITFQLAPSRLQITGLSSNKVLYANDRLSYNLNYYWDNLKYATSGQDPNDILDLPCIYLKYETDINDIQYFLHPQNVVIYVSGCFTYADDIRFFTDVVGDMKYTDSTNKTIVPNIDLYKDYVHTDADFIFKVGGTYGDSVKLNDTYDPQDSTDINGNGGNGGNGGGNGNGGTQTHNVTREPVTTYLNMNLTGMDFYTVTVKNRDGKIIAQLSSYGSPAYVPDEGVI